MGVRSHFEERLAVEKFAENAKLLPEGLAAASGAIGFIVGAVFVSHAEGVIQRIEGAATGKHEVPRLAKIGFVVTTEEAGFVVGDRLLQSIVGGGSFGEGIVEVDHARSRNQFFDGKAEVAVVLGDEVVIREGFFLGGDPGGYASLPLQ